MVRGDGFCAPNGGRKAGGAQPWAAPLSEVCGIASKLRGVIVMDAPLEDVDRILVGVSQDARFTAIARNAQY